MARRNGEWRIDESEEWLEGIDEDEAQRERVAMQHGIDERLGVPEPTDEEWDEAIAEDKWRVSGGLCGRTLEQMNAGSFDIVEGMGG